MATNTLATEPTTVGGDAGWRDSYKTAQMIRLPDVTSICGQQAGQLVQSLAQGVGCPEEAVLLPLLSCCSGIMGHRSEIRVHSGWSEPPVLWMVIGAGAGMRKSAALRQVLAPLLTLTEEMRQQEQLHTQQLQQHQEDGVNGGLDLPALYTGEMNLQQLHGMLHESAGGVLHISERLEDCHHTLNMHALQKEELRASRTQFHDLYEALAGRLATPPPADQKSTSKECSRNTLCHAMAYNQCGFASPEYVVNLTVKAPHWLSGRFLVACPAKVENSFIKIHTSHRDDSEGDDSSSSEPPRPKKVKRAKKLTLKEVYQKLACAHSQSSPRHYVFTKDAVSELQRFQEEEWCTIINQLGGEDSGGIVGKSMGQIVRLTGILKALTEASKPDLENGLSFSSEINMGEAEDTQVQIISEDVTRAVELGKYFLEQKLSMTFMVSTGFFRNSGTPRQRQDLPLPPVNQTTSIPSPYMPAPTSVNPLFGFPRHGTGVAPSTASAAGGVPSSPVPQPSHPQQTMPMTSLPSPLNPPFHFNIYGGPQLPSFPLMTNRGMTSPSFPPPSTSSPASNTASEIDVATLPATWIPATPEEEMAEMSQAADFVQLEPSQFVAIHARRVKRLLECFDDGCGVSATTAAQKSIAPPVRVAGTNNRHPAWASALFFQKVGDLGLGVAEQVRHPTNGRVYWRFKRKPMADLTEKNMQLLQYLRIDMVRYARVGQPTLNVTDIELEPVAGSGASERSLDEESNGSSGKGNQHDASVAGVIGIKQELI
ncbi:uncharacterized protein LOC143297400 [Babylonia areolata]|uniref:uncharacterized protein LOC143297400 n=1 Tax=Babylonia areolata TaxID=304850 RepID=UPI003FD1CD7A